MASFTDLPTELLLSILKHIPSTISLDWSSTQETAPNSVTLLLRSLMEKPQLGALVKDLHLHGRNFTGAIDWNILTPPVFMGALNFDKVASVIHGFQVQHAQEWERMARQGKMDAIVTLLLTFLPSLTRLRMLSNFAKETRILALTLLADIKASSSNSGVLPMRYSLQGASVTRYRQRSGKVKEDNAAESLLWFYLSNVRFLNLSIDNPKTFAWPLESLPCPSSLRSLTLTILREPHAKNVFAICNSLKQLDWTLDYKVDWVDISEPIFDLDGVTNALESLRGSLEKLTLMTSIAMGVSDIDFPQVDVRGSLAIVDFLAIKNFTFSWPLAMGLQPNSGRRISAAIPVNVQEITITSDGFNQTESFEWDEFSMLGPLEEFLTSYKEHTPFLEQLNLVVECTYATWSYRMRKEIYYMCAQVGLKCSIVHLVQDGPPFETPPPGWVWRAPESWMPPR